MAHRRDRGNKKDPTHRHEYVLKRTKYKWNKAYEFYECIGPGECDRPDKMEIRDRNLNE